VLVNIINAHGMFRAKIFAAACSTTRKGPAAKRSPKTLLQRQSACYKCPIRLRPHHQDQKQAGEGPEYETVWAFGAHLGISDLTAITEANYACNELGLDTITMGSTIGCARSFARRAPGKENLRWAMPQGCWL